jgi:hypothetical protein
VAVASSQVTLAGSNSFLDWKKRKKQKQTNQQNGR